MPTTAHSSHDEMLIARLYGDDLAADERAAALERVATCRDCAELLSDLAAISRGMTDLPVPARSRDFFLSEADATRLRHRRGGLARLFGLGARRSFGGALAALGIAGLLMVGTLSLLTPGASSSFAALDTTNGKVAAPEVGGAGSTAGPVSGGDLGTGGGAIALASASPAPSPARAAATAGSSIGAALTVSPPPSSGPLQVPSANPQDLAGAGTPAGGGQGAAPPVPTPGAPSAPGGLDLRILALVVSGAGLIAGLLILAVPSILRRRAS